jgi:hypothetical protein
VRGREWRTRSRGGHSIYPTGAYLISRFDRADADFVVFLLLLPTLGSLGWSNPFKAIQKGILCDQTAGSSLRRGYTVWVS